MQFEGLVAALSNVSTTPSNPADIINEEREDESDKKLILITADTKIKENPYIEAESDTFEDEISVEKTFAELSGKRKIVTFETLVGWDIVAELLQDGALNTDVRTAAHVLSVPTIEIFVSC